MPFICLGVRLGIEKDFHYSPLFLSHFIHIIHYLQLGTNTLLYTGITRALNILPSEGIPANSFLSPLHLGYTSQLYLKHQIEIFKSPSPPALHPARLNSYSKKHLAKMLSKILSLMYVMVKCCSELLVVKLSAGFCDYYFCFAAGHSGQLLPGLGLARHDL